jgi:GNAT superfamily N-acetyltransferase
VPEAEITVRPAVEADAPPVAEVYLAARRDLVSCAPLAHPDEAVRRWVAEHLIPAGAVTVAVSGEAPSTIVGMMALTRRDGVGWLDHLYVSPSQVGRGIGTRLLKHAKAELGSPIRLHTFQANGGARRFYERHGFRALAFGDGSGNEERCPDVLYEWTDTT